MSMDYLFLRHPVLYTCMGNSVSAVQKLTVAYSTRQKIITCSRLLKTGCNNVVLPILFIVVNNIVQHCWAWISPQSGVSMLNNIVDITMNNMGSTTFLHPVFNNLEQVIIFCLVASFLKCNCWHEAAHYSWLILDVIWILQSLLDPVFCAEQCMVEISICG